MRKNKALKSFRIVGSKRQVKRKKKKKEKRKIQLRNRHRFKNQVNIIFVHQPFWCRFFSYYVIRTKFYLDIQTICPFCKRIGAHVYSVTCRPLFEHACQTSQISRAPTKIQEKKKPKRFFFSYDSLKFTLHSLLMFTKTLKWVAVIAVMGYYTSFGSICIFFWPFLCPITWRTIISLLIIFAVVFFFSLSFCVCPFSRGPLFKPDCR